MKNFNGRCRKCIAIMNALPHYSCICTYEDWVVWQDVQGRLWLHDKELFEAGEWHEVECVYVQEAGCENYGEDLAPELEGISYEFSGEADDLSCYLYFKFKANPNEEDN